MSTPSPHPVPKDTIRLTVQIDVPYEHKIVNYGDNSKQVIKDYINSEKFGSYLLEVGGRSEQGQE